jgi:hypothetical protein
LLARLQKGCAGVAHNLSWDEPVGVMETIYSSIRARDGVLGSVSVRADNARL